LETIDEGLYGDSIIIDDVNLVDSTIDELIKDIDNDPKLKDKTSIKTKIPLIKKRQ